MTTMRIYRSSTSLWLAIFLFSGVWSAASYGIRQTGEIVFQSAPPGAEMFLDGTFIGHIPGNGRFQVSALPLTPLTFAIRSNKKIVFQRVIIPEDQNRIEVTVQESVRRAAATGPGPDSSARQPQPVQPVQLTDPQKTIQTAPAAASSVHEAKPDPQPAADSAQPPTLQLQTHQTLPALSGPVPPPLGLIFLLAFLVSSLFVLFLIWIRKRSRPPAADAVGSGSPYQNDIPEFCEADSATVSKSRQGNVARPFLEDLKHRESLINHGFTTLETGRGHAEPVLDLKDFDIGDDA